MTEKEPKDLGIKMGTKVQVFWTDVKEKAEKMIEQAGYEIEIQKVILGYAERKIKEEEKK